MRSVFGSYKFVAVAAGLSLSSAGLAYAQSSVKAKELPPGGEEIIITHQRLGPLSDWAAMQQHSADYQRLKAKYDPTTGSSHVDSWASDRSLAGPTQIGGGFEEESANAPTSPAVQAIKDAVVPP